MKADLKEKEVEQETEEWTAEWLRNQVGHFSIMPQKYKRIAELHNIALLQRKNEERWIKTSEKPPTENDADGRLNVLVRRDDEMHLIYWGQVVPGGWTYWMPIPPLSQAPAATDSTGEEEEKVL